MTTVRTALRWLMTAMFVTAGVSHFVRSDAYVRIMPPYLPWHLPFVHISGFFEIVLGLLLQVPHVRPLAAWGLMALLVAVFPANIHMAMNPELYPEIPEIALYIRLPFQGVLIAWAYWYTSDSPRTGPT